MFQYKKIKCSILLASLIALTSCNDKDSNSEWHSIISDSSNIELITEGYTFDTAGSPLYMNGSLYFTNNNFDSPDLLSRTFRMNSNGSIDSLKSGNGVTTTLRASGNGTIYACEMLGHRIVELDKDGQIVKVIVNEYNGARIDGPNDLIVDKKGGIYFTDSQFIAGREKKQPRPAVYYFSPQKEVLLVLDDVIFPNGLALSPDEQTLYVADTQGLHLLSYKVLEDGTVNNKQDFASFQLADNSEISGADGMVVDSVGNIYVATTQGLGVQVFNNKGKHLGNIKVPSPTNNVSFGGEDGRSLYISAQNGIYRILLKNEGLNIF